MVRPIAVLASLALVGPLAAAERLTAVRIGSDTYRLSTGAVVVTKGCDATGTSDVFIDEKRNELTFVEIEDECDVVRIGN